MAGSFVRSLIFIEGRSPLCFFTVFSSEVEGYATINQSLG